MLRLTVLALHGAKRMLGEVLRLFPGTLANVALVAGHGEVFGCMSTAARMSDDMVDDAAEMIEQGSGVPSPSWVMIRNRQFVAPRANELRRKSQGWWEDRGAMAKGTKPTASEQNLYLKQNRDSTSRRSSR